MTGRRLAAGQLALPLLLPHGPATVDGVPGQLDLVAAVMAHDPAAPAAARRLAEALSIGSGVPMRACADGAITNAPALV